MSLVKAAHRTPRALDLTYPRDRRANAIFCVNRASMVNTSSHPHETRSIPDRAGRQRGEQKEHRLHALLRRAAKPVDDRLRHRVHRDADEPRAEGDEDKGGEERSLPPRKPPSHRPRRHTGRLADRSGRLLHHPDDARLDHHRAHVHAPAKEPKRRRRCPMPAALAPAAQAEPAHRGLRPGGDPRPARLADVVATVKRASAHRAPADRDLPRDPLIFLLQEREELALDLDLLHHPPRPRLRRPGGEPPRWTFSSFLRGLLSVSLSKVAHDASWGPSSSWRCSVTRAASRITRAASSGAARSRSRVGSARRVTSPPSGQQRRARRSRS